MPIGERIADVEQALAAGDADSDEDLVTAASSALKVLYGVAGRYAEVLALGRRDLEGLASVRSRLEQADILRTAAVNAIMIGGQFEDGLAWPAAPTSCRPAPIPTSSCTPPGRC